jgi:dihydroflavonol-4-reductase
MLTAVTGASGMLGNTLVRQLLAGGDRVRVIATGSGTPRSLAGLDVELVRGSVLDASVLGSLVRGADRVFHLAAKVDLDRDRDGSIHSVNVEGTRKVAAACLEERVRLVHCSSHAALVKDPLSEPLDESKPLALADPCDYHRSKAQGERLVLDLVRTSGLDAVIVSPGTVTGPNDFKPSILGRALIDLYHRRIPVLMEVLSDYVDSRDVALGMIAAAERGRTGERYLLTGHVLTLREMVGHWGDLTGVSMPKRVLPLWVGWAMLPITIAVARVSRRPPLFTAGVLRASVSNAVVSHEKARQELGFSPRPIRDSLADALAFYRQEGLLKA